MQTNFSQQMGAVRIIAALVVSFTPTLVRGQSVIPAIGTRVTLKPGAVLKVGDRVVDTGKAHRTYVVKQAKDTWLWLTSGAIVGWVQASDVIPVDRAMYENVVALVDRGIARENSGDFDRAIVDFNEAIRLDPGNIPAHMNRGIAWQAIGGLDMAIADYDQAILGGLETAQAYNNRGHAWEQKMSYDKAIADYTEAIRLKPTYLLSWLNRGNAWKAKGEFAKGLPTTNRQYGSIPGPPWDMPCKPRSSRLPPSQNTAMPGGRSTWPARHASWTGRGTPLYATCVLLHMKRPGLDRAAQWRAKAREAASKASAGASGADHARLSPTRRSGSRSTFIDHRDQEPNQ